jgi:hypothetical protein
VKRLAHLGAAVSRCDRAVAGGERVALVFDGDLESLFLVLFARRRHA